MNKSNYLSLGLILSLFVVSGGIILYENIHSLSSSLVINFVSIIVGLAIALLCFVPSIIIKSKTNLSFPQFALKKTPSFIIFVSAIYSLIFLYGILYFLLKYVDVFSSTLNPEGNRLFVAFIIVAMSIYSSYKGGGAVVRSGTIIFVFAIIAYLLIIGGNISNLDFGNMVDKIFVNDKNIISSVSAFSTVSFISLIYLSMSESFEKFKIKQIIITLVLILALFSISIFFIWFSLGEYGKQQDFQMHLLSKSAQLGDIGGIDSFYLIVSALTIFMTVSLLLICIGKFNIMGIMDLSDIKERSINFNNIDKSNIIKRKKSARLINGITYSLIVLILFICAEKYSAVRDILTSSYILNILNFIASILIPSVYIAVFRRSLDV